MTLEATNLRYNFQLLALAILRLGYGGLQPLQRLVVEFLHHMKRQQAMSLIDPIFHIPLDFLLKPFTQ